MKKPLGYCAFEGYSRNHFYFYDRDKKNSVRVIHIKHGQLISDVSMGLTVENFEIDQFYKTGKVRHQFFLAARCIKETPCKIRIGTRCYVLAKVMFGKVRLRIKTIRIFDCDAYFNESYPEKPTRNFMLRFLSRAQVDPLM